MKQEMGSHQRLPHTGTSTVEWKKKVDIISGGNWLQVYYQSPVMTYQPMIGRNLFRRTDDLNNGKIDAYHGIRQKVAISHKPTSTMAQVG